MKKKLLLFAIGFILVSCSHIVIVHDPLTAKEHTELGYSYEESGSYDLAITQYMLAIKKDKDFCIPYFNLGNIYFKKNKLSLAKEYYRKAISCDKNFYDAMNNLALLYLKENKKQKALELIKKALKSEPTNQTYLNTLKEIEKDGN